MNQPDWPVRVRVAWLNALREIIAERPGTERNAAGAALVSDWDAIWSTDRERERAREKIEHLIPK